MTFNSRSVHPNYMARVAHYAPGAHFGPHHLHDYELVWLLSGSATWRVEETRAGSGQAEHHEHTLLPGTIALARADSTDSYAWDDERPSSHAYVHFTIDGGLPGVSQHDWPLVRTMTANDPLAALCSYLLSLARLTDAGARERSDEVVRLVVDILVNDRPVARAGDPSRHVIEALLFVSESWRSDGPRLVSLQELASVASVSPAYLSREFRKSYDLGFIAALELVRLGRAAIALQRSNLSIAEVARLSGFANPYHFSRRFSAAYGDSPGRFRRTSPDADPLSPVAAAGLLPVWSIVLADADDATLR